MLIEKVILSDNSEVNLTAYVCEPSPEMKHYAVRPAMLVIPGGGYSMCSDREAEPVALEYVAKGFNAFVLRYSVKTDFPAPLDDAIKALKLIRANAEKWYIDPCKVAVIGFSAGGHLAAALSTISEEKPNACVLGYPCIVEKISEILAINVPGLDDKVTPETPPTFIFAASNDTLVPLENSYQYALALEKNRVPYELHVFGNGGHGFSVATNIVTSKQELVDLFKPVTYWIQRSVDWLYECFNK